MGRTERVRPARAGHHGTHRAGPARSRGASWDAPSGSGPLARGIMGLTERARPARAVHHGTERVGPARAVHHGTHRAGRARSRGASWDSPSGSGPLARCTVEQENFAPAEFKQVRSATDWPGRVRGENPPGPQRKRYLFGPLEGPKGPRGRL